MDTGLKEIIDNFEQMKIDLDGTFKFHCKMCGKCCIHQERILLTPRDIYRMSKELKLAPKELFEQYCEAYIGSDSRMPIVRIKPRGSIKRCPFLKDRKCMVHQAKPAVCATFPIGRSLRMDGKNETPEDLTIDRIEYIYTNPGCGDDSENHSVREWLHDFNLSEEDEFFLKWQQTVLKLSAILYKVEKKVSNDVIELVWTAAFAGLYLNYDMDQKFMTQFEENVEELITVLRMALDEGEKANEQE